MYRSNGSLPPREILPPPRARGIGSAGVAQWLRDELCNTKGCGQRRPRFYGAVPSIAHATQGGTTDLDHDREPVHLGLHGYAVSQTADHTSSGRSLAEGGERPRGS